MLELPAAMRCTGRWRCNGDGRVRDDRERRAREDGGAAPDDSDPALDDAPVALRACPTGRCLQGLTRLECIQSNT